MLSKTLLFISLAFLGQCHGARILSVTFMTSVSHRIITERLYKTLAERGHQLTIVSPLVRNYGNPNITEIQTLDMEEIYKEMDMGANVYERRAGASALSTALFPPMLVFAKAMATICRKSYELPALQNLLKEKFDLILFSPFFNECLYGLIHKLNAPVVLTTQVSVFSWIAGHLGSPSPPSFVPTLFMDLSDDMNFMERVLNFLSVAEVFLVTRFYYEPMLEDVYRKALNDSSLPSIPEIEATAALLLENQDSSFTKPRPRMGDIISVGGMHMYPPKPLPKDLADFADGAGSDGFIFFSMGSALRGSEMPDSMRKMFLKVFGSLKQRVIWKWETEIMDGEVPENVKLSKWVPQMDLLAHKNIKAFITHGGHGGLTEAIYNGVPLIGIPMFGDQLSNMRIAARFGFAVYLEFSELSEKVLKDAINDVLYNDKYSKSAKERSAIFHERPQDPMETAVFWTEYVIKHKGAPHLRSVARDLSFIQYYSFDVIGFLLLVVGVSLTMVYLLFKKVYTSVKRCFCRNNRAASSSKSKKE